MELEEGGRRPAAGDGFAASAEAAQAVAQPERPDGVSRDPSRALDLLKELGSKLTEESVLLMPNLLSCLKHDNPIVVKQSIASGTSLFGAVLEEMALQLHDFGKVEAWLEEIWSWMVRFKDAVHGIALGPGSIAKKVLAVKFLEICVLYFTPDANDNGVHCAEEWSFNVSQLAQGHSTVNPASLESEANRIVSLLLDILQSANTLRGSFVIAVINCLAATAKSRPVHYNLILSALLGFDPDFETLKEGHAASIRYSLRTAFLGFLRSNHPSIIESRDKLVRALRAINPGEATDQIIRQVEKMSRSTERISRDSRASKDDPPSGQISVCDDLMRKRPASQPSANPAISDEMAAKRTRLNTATIPTPPAQTACDLQIDDDGAVNDLSSNASLMDNDLTPVEKMIAMIGALLAEGERGVESLELLISTMQADLLADIVIETMKHLPTNPLDLSDRHSNLQTNPQRPSSSFSSQIVSTTSATIFVPSSAASSQLASTAVASSGISTPTSDASSLPNLLPDFKRDPRRLQDPRRLDPRRAVASVSSHSEPLNLDNIDMQPGLHHSLSKHLHASDVIKVETPPVSLISKSETELYESSTDPVIDHLASKEKLDVLDDPMEPEPSLNVSAPSNSELSPVHAFDPELAASTSSDITANEDVDGNMPECDQYSSPLSAMSVIEDNSHDLPALPLHIELMDEQKRTQQKLAVTRIIEDYKQIRATGSGQACLPLLARLVLQANADDDIIKLLQKHIISDYHLQKGHELAMHVLYHLHTVIISDLDESSSSATSSYEKFLLAVAKALLDSLPASDKSFSKLLAEAPFLPNSTLKLLEDLCHSHGYSHLGKDTCDADRVTQGLGAVWSLILGRPPSRQACLDIALKCAVHSQDEVRAKAIRLVSNKLYPLRYASDIIEQFATRMLFSVVNQQVSEGEFKPACSSEQRSETCSQETSISGSQNSEVGGSESEFIKGIQTSLSREPAMSFSQAQQQTSLFFALCTKKPCLLKLVFDIYGGVPKAVKQSIHRHVAVLVRTLGSSYPELLHMISDPPEGSENLIMLVLQTMTEEATPSAELIAAVKHLYETKLKDVAILIPMLSSLSKDEVLPIFPRLVDLPLEKFQTALARILQGSAHTGPALTPAEVLIAIHDIDPEKDGVALKKITDACTACFEQRTVFTQHVLAKSLSHLVEQVPIPLLFMRTVIQAIDAFPTLVDFVMGILSKLVSKQIWKMPKLWVGFLKCASQTQPHSFHVLLQLPPPQLESALNKYANLRGPLTAYANQPNIRNSLSRQTLKLLGLVNEQQQAPRSFTPTALRTSDTSSSVHGATLI
ncbi:uncharacterized protein LOC103713953 isoform X3 [Phoenix dactylifera]|uniref:Uncharacterized protein LOC103713953 isoform X3 n=1 Tax=Phoenix dactylifera TaxID=42345 RepID=A0A8B7MV97_PHODC|nr:uncharacterized protein LOC103713953 isoform X3 [Phoenix dactylifera]